MSCRKAAIMRSSRGPIMGFNSTRIRDLRRITLDLKDKHTVLISRRYARVTGFSEYFTTVETRYNDPRYSDILSNTIRPYGPVLF
jgi:hypothetical protein